MPAWAPRSLARKGFSWLRVIRVTPAPVLRAEFCDMPDLPRHFFKEIALIAQGDATRLLQMGRKHVK
jgi:hypothetical protein